MGDKGLMLEGVGAVGVQGGGLLCNWREKASGSKRVNDGG